MKVIELTPEESDWIRSPQVIGDNVSDADLEWGEEEDDLTKADFEEDKHPRDEDGKFAPKGTGRSGGGKAKAPAAKPSAPVMSAPAKSTSDLDSLPEVVAWRDKKYTEALDELEALVLDRAPYDRADMIGEIGRLARGMSTPKSAYEDFVRSISVYSWLPADVIKSHRDKTRVAEWRYLKGLTLPPKPVTVTGGGTKPSVPDVEPIVLDWQETGSASTYAEVDDRFAEIVQTSKDRWMVFTGVKGIDEERSEAYNSQEEALQAAENHLGNGRPVATYKVKQPKLVTDISREISRWRTPKWLNDESHYKRIASDFETTLRGASRGRGVPVDEYRDRLFAQVHSLLDNQPVRVRMRLSHIESMLSEPEERYKTQFETGVSGGCLDNDYRSRSENEGLSVPIHVDNRYRPAYGYINDGFGDPGQYGEVGFVLNENVKKRTTVTPDDSLGRMGRRFTPLPLTQVLPGRLPNDPEEMMYVSAFIGNEISSIESGSPSGGYGYLEAQIQGGWHMGEVDSVVFYSWCFDVDGRLKPKYRQLETQFKDRGIKVEYNATKR